MHIELHLHEVFGLGLLHALLRQVVKALFAVRFELGNVALLGRLGYAGFNDGVETAGHVRAKVHALLLGAGHTQVEADSAQV